MTNTQTFRFSDADVLELTRMLAHLCATGAAELSTTDPAGTFPTVTIGIAADDGAPPLPAQLRITISLAGHFAKIMRMEFVEVLLPEDTNAWAAEMCAVDVPLTTLSPAIAAAITGECCAFLDAAENH